MSSACSVPMESASPVGTGRHFPASRPRRVLAGGPHGFAAGLLQRPVTYRQLTNLDFPRDIGYYHSRANPVVMNRGIGIWTFFR